MRYGYFRGSGGSGWWSIQLNSIMCRCHCCIGIALIVAKSTTGMIQLLYLYDILPDKGKISAKQARQKAEAEYQLFNPTQKITSDFDKALKRMEEKL